MSQSSPRSSHRLAAGTLAIAVVGANDPSSTRVVYAMVIGLVVVGIVFVALGVWLIRQTRVDLPVLAPLERMGERAWQRTDAPTQRRLLEEVRPPGATPLRTEPAPPRFDAEFGARRPPESLSDLGPGLAEPKEPTPTDAPFPAGEPPAPSSAGADDAVLEPDADADEHLDETPDSGEDRPEISAERSR